MTLLKTTLSAAFLSLLVAPAAFATQQGDKQTEDRIKAAMANNSSYSGVTVSTRTHQGSGDMTMPLTILISKNTDWASSEGQAQIEADIQSTVEMYSKCGIDITPVSVIKASNSDLSNVDCAYDYGNTYKLTDDAIPRPLAFYAGAIQLCGNKFAAEGTVAYANPPKFTENVASGLKVGSTGTVYISDERLEKLSRDATYASHGGQVTLGHEIGHLVLDDLEHRGSTANMMDPVTGSRAGNISTTQCQTIRSSRYVRSK